MNELFFSIRFIIVLILCCLCYIPMNQFRFSKKTTNIYFFIFTAIIIVFNIFLALQTENNSLSGIMLFSIAVPYFILIMILTKGSIAKRSFNFWVWINIYQIISTIISIFKYIEPNNYILDIFINIILFIGYYFFYNIFIKEKHHKILNELNINWWVVSIIPILFTLSFRYICILPGPLSKNPQNIPKAIMLNLLIISVYALMYYTFKTAVENSTKKQVENDLKMQLNMLKNHYQELGNKKQEEIIFRHDARHRDMLLLSLAENQQNEKIIELLKRDIETIHVLSETVYTQSLMINAILSEYFERAEKKGIKIKHDIRFEKNLKMDEMEFCVMLSNLLENAVHSATSFIEVMIKQVNSQLCFSIKNDYTEKTECDKDGNYISTKANGSGIGLKSVKNMLERIGGFLQIDDDGTFFNVFVSVKN